MIGSRIQSRDFGLLLAKTTGMHLCRMGSGGPEMRS